MGRDTEEQSYWLQLRDIAYDRKLYLENKIKGLQEELKEKERDFKVYSTLLNDYELKIEKNNDEGA